MSKAIDDLPTNSHRFDRWGSPPLPDLFEPARYDFFNR